MLCYVMLCYMLRNVTLCFVSSMNTVQQSDNGTSICDRSEVSLFVCLFVFASGTVTASYKGEVSISGLKRPKREGCHCDLMEKVRIFISPK